MAYLVSKIQPDPNYKCQRRECGIPFKDHKDLNHEHFGIYRIGSWRTEDNKKEVTE